MGRYEVPSRAETPPHEAIGSQQQRSLRELLREGRRVFSVGTACGVGWADVDLDAGQLTVRRQLVQLGWEVYEDDPKSDAGGRTIALDTGT